MKRRWTIVLGVVAALAATAIGVAASASAAGPDRPTLAVYGDSPYLDKSFPALPHAEFDATPAFIDTINADPRRRHGRERRVLQEAGATFPLEWLKLTIDEHPAQSLASTATSWGPFSWVRETQPQLSPS
jgi:hypothetical protein